MLWLEANVQIIFWPVVIGIAENYDRILSLCKQL
jgi:hypothetical protein